MVKKIMKYAKFMVCIILMVSLIAPSYAALSASDGSAFVTKAEFDSALADFNARLTTFEAGINSKIDSQVTSYLDRNGIWNGQNQDFDIKEKYRSKGYLYSVTGLDTWYTTKNKYSQLEQINFMSTTDANPCIPGEKEASKTILWKNGEQTYTATYTVDIGLGNRDSAYTRIFFMDDAFTAKKSGLCFYNIGISWGGATRFWQPKFYTYDLHEAELVTKGYFYNLYYMKTGSPTPQLIAFWYATTDKVAEFGSRSDDDLIRHKPVSPSWEYLPSWAIGTQMIDAGGVMTPLGGNFFVEKGKSYGFGVRPWYCYSCEDYQWFTEDTKKMFDTSQYAMIYFGPVSQWYARYLPKISIY